MASTRSLLLAILLEHENEYVSGQELGEKIGVSRNAIWKATMKLKEEGYIIDASTGQGYRLRKGQDVLSETKLYQAFDGDVKFICLDAVESTSDYAKTIKDLSRPVCVIANEQTAGRGRMGRSFFSPPDKGLYLTFAFEPNFAVDDALLITSFTAVAVTRAIEKVAGLRTSIKWVNDIYYRRKKVAGILTEANANFETGNMDKMYVGIGINCFEQEFPGELREKATWLEEPTRKFSREELVIALVNEFFGMLDTFQDRRLELLRDARTKSCILGKEILIRNPAIAKKIGQPKPLWDEPFRATAIDLDENGGLVVELIGGRQSRQMLTISSGEVSIML